MRIARQRSINYVAASLAIRGIFPRTRCVVLCLFPTEEDAIRQSVSSPLSLFRRTAHRAKTAWCCGSGSHRHLFSIRRSRKRKSTEFQNEISVRRPEIPSVRHNFDLRRTSLTVSSSPQSIASSVVNQSGISGILRSEHRIYYRVVVDRKIPFFLDRIEILSLSVWSCTKSTP